jgi:hypothetical protein
MSERQVSLDFTDVCARAAAYYDRVSELKRSNPLAGGYDWYPYDTLGIFQSLNARLNGENRRLFENVVGLPVADIGAGDGDMSTFLGSLGFEVDAVDFGPTNYNGMHGLRRLIKLTNTAVNVTERDLDRNVDLPRGNYGLAIVLGILYHLKNPFLLLESVARVSRYCLLSTRVAKYTPDRGTRLAEAPLAYLVGPEELNGDRTNFWIFSEAGLRRIVERAGWSIREYYTIGCTGESDPVHADADERAICLLRSRLADREWRFELGDGWNDLEPGGFRWTRQRFSVRIPCEETAAGRVLKARFYVPPERIAELAPVTLRAWCNGTELSPYLIREPGFQVYEQALPPDAVGRQTIELQFALDKTLGDTADDPRERGIVVPFFVPGVPAEEAEPPFQIV